MAKISSRCLSYFPAAMIAEEKAQELKKVHQYGDSILGCVNMHKTFRQISEVWENAETLNLEKCRLYLCLVKSYNVTIS